MTESNLNEAFFVIVFLATMDTIQTEQKLQNQFKTMIIPTPREISKSCGFAIRFFDVDEEILMKAVKDIKVPHSLYWLSHKHKDGRIATLIESTE